MEGAKQDNNGSKVKSSACNDSNMVKTLKLESFDLNDSHRDSQSFSQLLRNVLSRNSPCSAIKAKHQMPPKTPEVVKPEVAEKLELNSECAKPCASLVSVTPSAIFGPCSAPAVASTVDNYTPLEVAGTPGMDGYSWRKYGQKQLKNTNTYRSYYRCTHSGCVAKKKVQQFEQSGDVINIVHIGDHNHGPPQRSYSSRSRWLTSSEKISVAKHAEVPLLQKVDRFNINNTNVQQSSHNMQRSKELYTRSPSGDTGRVKSGEETGEVLDSKRLCLTNGGSPKCSSCWISNPEVQEKHDAEHTPEMRKEDSNKSHLDSISKATKKHKTVVPDAKISPDGYRWRKYGQKFVKGNSHTRSYYRCKLAGCPARKQVEKAVNDATEIAITYEWEHNHDVHADHSCVIVSSTAPMIRANIKNTESLTTQDPLTNWSAERKQESSGAKVLKNGVVKDNISGTKNFEVSSVRKTDSSDMNSADVRQSSEHKSGSEPQSSNVSDCDIRKVEVEDQHIDTPESKQVSCSNARGSQQSSSGWVAKTKMQEKNDTELEPSPKKRKEESKNSRSDLKATKKHKIDVQDAAETRISHDRCRWRKYGQKLVKGNSHVRSYYRCTSTGCPARKHVETAVNDATATTETFEGEHKHDVPVIRKQCVPPTTFVNTGCAEKTETLTNASCLTKQQEDREGDLLGERVMELGGEKALESAQTLLSIKVDVRQ